MGLNQKTTAQTEQALLESNETQQLISALQTRLQFALGHLDAIRSELPIDAAQYVARLNDIITLLSAQTPTDTAPIITRLQAIIDLLSAQAPADNTQVIAKLQAIIDALLNETATDLAPVLTKLQAIIDLLADDVPVDTASIVNAIQLGTAETHEVVARLDYIGDQANLAALKAAILEVVARLDYIGDQANLLAIKETIEELYWRLDGLQGQIDNLDDIMWIAGDIKNRLARFNELVDRTIDIRNASNYTNDKLELIIGRNDRIGDASEYTNEKLELIIGRIDRLYDDFLPLLNNLLAATKALKAYNPETDPTRWTASSDGMGFVPMGVLPGLNDVISPFWSSPPLGLAYGTGALHVPERCMLAAPAGGWSGWSIFVESSANVYARDYLSIERFKTNEWHMLSGSNVLIVWVDGHDYVRLWLDSGQTVGGGGTTGGGGGTGDPPPGTIMEMSVNEICTLRDSDKQPVEPDRYWAHMREYDPAGDNKYQNKTCYLAETYNPNNVNNAFGGGYRIGTPNRDYWVRMRDAGTTAVLMNDQTVVGTIQHGTWLHVPITAGAWSVRSNQACYIEWTPDSVFMQS